MTYGADHDHHHGAFADAVLNPQADVPKGVARANGADPREAFNIYRNNVVVSLVEALKAAFPVTSQLLGEGLQKALMGDFVRAHPPKSAVLADYGDVFPSYLAGHRATKARPFLAEIALLERRRTQAYHAADAPVLDPQVLANLDPDDLSKGYLRVHPAVRLVASRMPVATIYAIERQAMQPQGMEGTLPENGRGGVDLSQGEQVLVTRPHFDVGVQAIGAGDFAFVRACARTVPFGVAADDAFEADPAFDFQACLGLCLASGVFSAFETNPSFKPPSTPNSE